MPQRRYAGPVTPEDSTPLTPAVSTPAPRRKYAGAVTPTEEPTAPDESSWGDYLGFLIRGAAGYASGIPSAVPGVGTAIGAGIGAVGNLAAQGVERGFGSRKKFSGTDFLLDAGVGAVPFGGIAKAGKLIARGAATGVTSGALANIGQQYEETGDLSKTDLGQVLWAGGTGGLLGTAGAGVGHGIVKGAERWRGGRPAVQGMREAAQAVDPTRGMREGESLPNFRAKGPLPPDEPIALPEELQRAMAGFDETAEAANRAGAVGVPRRAGPPPSDDPLSVSLSGTGFEGLEPSRVRGGYGNAAKQTGFKRYAGGAVTPVRDTGGATDADLFPGVPVRSAEAPAADDIDGLLASLGLDDGTAAVGARGPSGSLDVLSPDEGLQFNASGATGASTEALNRAGDFRQQGIRQFKVTRAGETTPQLDPTQIADPWQHLGKGESVVRVHPDGRVELVAGDTMPANFKAPGGEDTLNPLAPMGQGKLFVPAEHVTAWNAIKDAIEATPGGNVAPDVITASRQWQTSDPRRLWSKERAATRKARERVGERLLPVDPTQTPRNPMTPDQLDPAFPRPESGPPTAATAASMVAGDALAATPPKKDALSGIFDLFGGDESGVAGEAGAIDPKLLFQLAYHLGGAATGAGVAGALSDEDTRTRNMVGAVILGGAAPAAVTHPQLLARLRYASMLGGFSPQVKNVLGGAGGTMVRSAEEGLTKLLGGAQDASPSALLGEVFSPDTLRGMREAFADAGTATPRTLEPTRWGQTQGILGAPSRTMHAVDEGFTGGMQRAGLLEDDARTSLMTSMPKSLTGKKIAELAHQPTISTLVPFARTATNMVERGLEHTPLIGELPDVKGMRNSAWQRRAARQLLGLTALGAGAAGGEYLDDTGYAPYAAAAMGPLALPYLMGTAGAAAMDERGDPFSNVVQSPFDVLRAQTPLPTSPYPWEAGRYLSSYVPGVVRDANLVDPRNFATHQSVFDPTIAKIPILNEAVLPKKRRRAVAR